MSDDEELFAAPQEEFAADQPVSQLSRTRRPT